MQDTVGELGSFEADPFAGKRGPVEVATVEDGAGEVEVCDPASWYGPTGGGGHR